jgi:hypothetical protein
VKARLEEASDGNSGVGRRLVRAAGGARSEDFSDDETVDEETLDEPPDDIPTPSITEPPPVSFEAHIDSPSAERAIDSSPSIEGPDPSGSRPAITPDAFGSNPSIELARDALDARVDRLFRAERYFRRGEKALARRRPDDAVTAFEKAVALCPEEGEFLAHLGYARYQAADADTHAVDRATDELERAARLAPKLDITHLLLARVLADLGRAREARDAYELALAANPDCAEALEGLHDLSVG